MNPYFSDRSFRIPTSGQACCLSRTIRWAAFTLPLALLVCGCGSSPDEPAVKNVNGNTENTDNRTIQVPSIPEELSGVLDEQKMAGIETELQIQLPKPYREYMLKNATRLRNTTVKVTDSNTKTRHGTRESWFETTYWNLDAKSIVYWNQVFRAPKSNVGYAFPNWSQTYFLIGDNGGPGVYAMRLDGSPEVWELAFDSGKKSQVADSLKEMTDSLMKRYQHNRPLFEKEFELFEQKERGELTEDEYKSKIGQLDFDFGF